MENNTFPAAKNRLSKFLSVNLSMWILVFVAGVVVAQSTNRYGPFGGGGGRNFADVIPGGARITELRIRAGAYVDAIEVFYRFGKQIASFPRRGGTGGQLYRFVLAEDEFITGISGRHGAFVDSIVIHTNRRRSSPRYGGSGGAYSFKILVPQNHAVVGFFGRSGVFLDAVGIVSRPR